MSELVKDAASKAMTETDVILTAARKLIGSGESMAPIVRFMARNVEQKIGKVGNNYEKREIRGPRYCHLRQSRSHLIRSLPAVLKGQEEMD